MTSDSKIFWALAMFTSDIVDCGHFLNPIEFRLQCELLASSSDLPSTSPKI